MTKEDTKDLAPEVVKFRFDEQARMIVRALDAGEMTHEEIAAEFNCTLEFVGDARSRLRKNKQALERYHAYARNSTRR